MDIHKISLYLITIITKNYTISHPFHDNILRTIKFVINENFNFKKI